MNNNKIREFLNEDIDVIFILTKLYKRKFIILVCSFCFVLFSHYYYSSVKIHQYKSIIEFEYNFETSFAKKEFHKSQLKKFFFDNNLFIEWKNQNKEVDLNYIDIVPYIVLNNLYFSNKGKGLVSFSNNSNIIEVHSGDYFVINSVHRYLNYLSPKVTDYYANILNNISGFNDKNLKNKLKDYKENLNFNFSESSKDIIDKAYLSQMNIIDIKMPSVPMKVSISYLSFNILFLFLGFITSTLIVLFLPNNKIKKSKR